MIPTKKWEPLITRKGFLERKKKQIPPPPPPIFHRVFKLQSRDKKSNTRRGDNSKSKKKPKLSFLYVTCHLVLLFITTKYHQNIPKSVQLTQQTLNQCINSVKYNKGRTAKVRKAELSFL